MSFDGVSFGADLSKPSADDPQRFGSETFYAGIGRAFIQLCAFVPVLYVIEAIDWLISGSSRIQLLDELGGIRPWHLDGLPGIIFAPFLHAGFGHLGANSVALVLLGTFVLAGQPKRFIAITALIAVVSGLGVWFTSSPNRIVVGASGVIFGYLGYLLVRGIVEHSIWYVVVSALIGVLYGWQVIGGVLPGKEGISWQGHLFGLLGGVLAAIVFRRRRPKPAPRPTPQTLGPPGVPGTV